MRLAYLSCATEPAGAFVAAIGKTKFVIEESQLLPSEEVSRVNALRGLRTKTLVSLWRDQVTGQFGCGRPY